MKIIYFANARIPTEKAHGLQIMKMCEAFALQGVKLELLIPTRINKGFAKVDPFIFYNVNNNFVIRKVFTFDPLFLLKIGNGLYIKFQSLFFAAGLSFYLFFKKDRQDYIFYTRDHYLLKFLNIFSSRLVFEIHNMPLRPEHYVSIWRKCFKIIAITNGLKEELVKLGISSDKIIVSPDAVNIKDFLIKEAKVELKEKLKLPLDKNLVVYTGHLYDWKGAELLATVADKLNNNAVIVFVGGTDQDIVKFKNSFGKVKNIIIKGRVVHSLIPSFLKAADILVLPNSAKHKISKFYTSPMKLFEYMASGVPIVAADLPSIKEIVSVSEVLFFTPDNQDDLAEKINRLLSKNVNGENLAKNSFIKVQEYTWENRAKKIIYFLNEQNIK